MMEKTIQIEFYNKTQRYIYTLKGIKNVPGIVDKKRFFMEKGEEPNKYLTFYNIGKENIEHIEVINIIPTQKIKVKPFYRSHFRNLQKRKGIHVVHHVNEGKPIYKRDKRFLVHCELHEAALAELFQLKEWSTEEVDRFMGKTPKDIVIIVRSKDIKQVELKVFNFLGNRKNKYPDLCIKTIYPDFIYKIKYKGITEISELEYATQFYKRKISVLGVPIMDMTNYSVYQGLIILKEKTHIHKIDIRKNPNKKYRDNRKWHKEHRTKKYYVPEVGDDRKVSIIRPVYYKNPQTGEDKVTGHQVARVWKSELYDHDSIYSSTQGWKFCSKSKWKQLREQHTFVPVVKTPETQTEKYYGKRAFRTLQIVTRNIRVGNKKNAKQTQIANERAQHGDII